MITEQLVSRLLNLGDVNKIVTLLESISESVEQDWNRETTTFYVNDDLAIEWWGNEFYVISDRYDNSTTNEYSYQIDWLRNGRIVDADRESASELERLGDEVKWQTSAELPDTTEFAITKLTMGLNKHFVTVYRKKNCPVAR